MVLKIHDKIRPKFFSLPTNGWYTKKTYDGVLKVLQRLKNGNLIYSNGYGIGDLEHNIKITSSSVFYIGSVSKQFVTFSILLLEEQGKLNLDDKIQKYLPDFPEYDSPLTIRHFIHHTSGVRDYLTLMYLRGRSYLDKTDKNEVYELIKKQKELNFSPGEKYLYSNSCYFMLAMIIEKAAGQSLKIFAHENIFEPLGMKNSLFYDDNTDLIKNRVFSYKKRSNKEGFDNLIMRFDLVGSGGVYSNIEDLFLWDQNFYNNKLGKGGQKIINKMHKEGLLNNGESSGYAFALNNGVYRGLKTVSHAGSLAGYRAQLMRFPEEKTSIIILANRGDSSPTDKSLQIADIMLKNEFSEEPQNKEENTGQSNKNKSKKLLLNQSISNLQDYTGNFYSEELDFNYLVILKDGQLKVKIADYKAQDLIKFGIDKFTIDNGLINFNRENKVIVGFELDAGRVSNLKFEKNDGKIKINYT